MNSPKVSHLRYTVKDITSKQEVTIRRFDMAISSVYTLEVPDVCHRWLENRGTIYQLLTEFIGHSPTLSLVAHWSRSSGINKAAELTRGGRELRYYLIGRSPEELVQICERESTEYHRLLHSKHRPLAESRYSPYSCCSQDLSDVYASAGVAFKKVNGEPDDHLAIELEFMTVLHDRMLNSIHCEASVMELVDIQINFLEEHLLTWIPALCRELNASTTSPVYLAVSRLLAEFLEYDLAMLRTWKHFSEAPAHEPVREAVLV
ncbi:TorD/DmsD family molecular chaperone [Paenibacillus dakarensis]|uniref:TorD/DmsD family molecular chaperone n=1 Tax=Paenibacillus dakarensis TaxID=1527293 RepID=UPI000AAC3A63|nr:molecular chaperone TorD family protein [Paenibacillus dakarensis]